MFSSVCEIPAGPDYGSANVSVDRSTVTYACDVGYVMIGIVTRTCQNDGLGWSDDPPTCRTYTQCLVFNLFN